MSRPLWQATLGLGFEAEWARCIHPRWTSIARRVWREVKLAERAPSQARACPPLDEAWASTPGAADPAQAWEASALRAACRDLVARLPERLRIVILARYGWTGQSRVCYRMAYTSSWGSWEEEKTISAVTARRWGLQEIARHGILVLESRPRMGIGRTMNEEGGHFGNRGQIQDP